jgi:RNA polymerase sigma factor (sigma-70 family)
VAPQHRSSGPKMTDEDVEQLYECYRAELQKFFLGCTRNAQLVEDLMQELYRCLLEYHPPKVLLKPQSYVIRVAWSVLNDANARAQQQPPSVSCDPVTLDRLAAEHRGNLWFEDGATGLEAAERFERALKRLRPTDSMAIILQRRDGLSYEAIARRMGVSRHTVKKYIGRGLRQLRNYFGGAVLQKSTSDD